MAYRCIILPAKNLIKELSEVMRCIEYIEHICKNEGLSKAGVIKCKIQIENTLTFGNSRMNKLSGLLSEFLDKEILLLDTEETSHNNSTDVLESLFGVFKSRKSKNKLHGVTSFILFLPAYTELSKINETKNYKIKRTVRANFYEKYR